MVSCHDLTMGDVDNEPWFVRAALSFSTRGPRCHRLVSLVGYFKQKKVTRLEETERSVSS